MSANVVVVVVVETKVERAGHDRHGRLIKEFSRPTQKAGNCEIER